MKDFGKDRRHIGEILKQLCSQQGIDLVKGKVARDHVHMLLSVPSKYSITITIEYLKGKSAIRMHRDLLKTLRNFVGASVLVTRVLCKHDRTG